MDIKKSSSALAPTKVKPGVTVPGESPRDMLENTSYLAGDLTLGEILKTNPKSLNRPKYRQIEELIRARIESGELVDGAKLPSEQELARDFGVAYMTARSAINALVNQGLLQRIHGRGTFVTVKPASLDAGSLTLVVPSLQQLWSVANLYYFPAIVQGFCAEATRLGYEPSVIARSKEAFLPNSSEFANVAGAACLLFAEEDMDVVEMLRDMNIVTVGINNYQGRRAISYVQADQIGGMRDAVEFLVLKGHRHITFFPGPPNNFSAAQRERGYRQGMKEFGLKAKVIEPETGDYTDGSGYSRAKAVLADAQRPTAILTAGDLIAAGALRAAREMKVSVPRSLSVLGFGDVYIANQLQPPLSSVRLPRYELGEQAASLLHRQITGVQTGEIVTLPMQVVKRSSVASPRKCE